MALTFWLQVSNTLPQLCVKGMSKIHNDTTTWLTRRERGERGHVWVTNCDCINRSHSPNREKGETRARIECSSYEFCFCVILRQFSVGRNWIWNITVREWVIKGERKALCWTVIRMKRGRRQTMCDKDKNGILRMGAVRYITASIMDQNWLIIKTSEPSAFVEHLAGTED